MFPMMLSTKIALMNKRATRALDNKTSFLKTFHPETLIQTKLFHRIVSHDALYKNGTNCFAPLKKEFPEL